MDSTMTPPITENVAFDVRAAERSPLTAEQARAAVQRHRRLVARWANHRLGDTAEHDAAQLRAEVDAVDSRLAHLMLLDMCDMYEVVRFSSDEGRGGDLEAQFDEAMRVCRATRARLAAYIAVLGTT